MESKQYSIRTEDYTTAHIEEAVLDDAIRYMKSKH